MTQARLNLRWRDLLWRPGNMVLLAVLVLLLIGLTVATWTWIDRDREQIAGKFSREQFQALEMVTSEIEEEMQDVIDDLRFARRLVNTSRTRRDLRRPLIALLGNSRAYRAVILPDLAGQQYATIVGRRRPLPVSKELDEAVRRVVSQARHAKAEELKISLPVNTSGGWYRIFAVSNVPREGAPQVGAVALIVGMRAHFGKLRFAAASPGTELLILGPAGRTSPRSGRRIARAVKRSRAPRFRGVLRSVLQRMVEGQRGMTRIPESEASRLRLGRSEQVVVYMPIRMRGGVHWSVAMVTSLAAARGRERGLILRLGLGAAAVALLLVGFTVVLLRTSYQKAVLDERVRGAVEIAHLHEKAARILESIPTGVLVLGDRNQVTDLNRSMTAWLPGLVPGMSLVEAFAEAQPAALERLTELVRQALESQETATFVGEHLWLFGARGHYRVHAVALSPPRPEASALLVVEDITEMKTLEEQLLRTEKLATIGTLSAGIAHEIGTPLSVVRGRTELALSRLGSDHPLADGLRTVIDQTDRVVRTVRELLDFSRAHPTRLDRVRLGDVIDKSIELLRYEAERRKIRIVLDLAADLPDLAADADQLQQVMVNLLMNAFDASAVGSEVSVTARLAAPDPSGGPPTMRIEVLDQGSGITPGDEHRIFDAFYTTKKRGQGTGLGLFIVSQIVRSHDARISFQGALGQGSRAVVLWPIHQGPGPGPKTRQEPKQEQQNVKAV